MVAGVPAPAAQLLSNHYNETRSRYIERLDEASKSGGNVAPFFHYVLQGFVDGLKKQLDYIYQQNFDLLWFEYCRFKLEELRVPIGVRRLLLIRHVYAKRNPVKLQDIAMIPDVSRAYRANKTDRALIRDLTALVEAGLLRREKGKYESADELLLSLQPERLA